MVVIYNFTSYLHTLIFFNGKKIISFSTLRGAGGEGKKLEEDSAGEANAQ